MRHQVGLRKFNRTTSHRRAMLRNMAQSMIQHGRIRTTLPKAKDLRPYVERLVTLARRAKEGDIVARRRIHRLLSDRSMIPEGRQGEYDDLSLAKRAKTLRAPSGRRYRAGKPQGRLKFTGESVTTRLINEIAPRYSDRSGGYTRLIKLPHRRIGDGGWEAVLEFVGDEKSAGSITRPAKTARARRADGRYALAVRLVKQSRAAGKSTGGSSAAAVADDGGPDEAAATESGSDQEKTGDEAASE